MFVAGNGEAVETQMSWCSKHTLERTQMFARTHVYLVTLFALDMGEFSKKKKMKKLFAACITPCLGFCVSISHGKLQFVHLVSITAAVQP